MPTEQLDWIKNFLDTGTMVAMLALSLVVNAFLFRKLGQEKDRHLTAVKEHMETVREIIPIVDKMKDLAGNLGDIVQWMRAIRQRWGGGP